MLQKTITKKPPRTYKILGSSDLSYLMSRFLENPYPTKAEMNRMGKELDQTVDKVRNWFKHQRKKEVLQGKRSFEKKNSFSKSQSALLLQEFKKNTNPDASEYEKMAEQLCCQVKHVRHWFSHRRKLALKNHRSGKSTAESFQKKEDFHSNSTKDIRIKEEIQERKLEDVSHQKTTTATENNEQIRCPLTLPLIVVNNEVYQRILQQNICNWYAQSLCLRMLKGLQWNAEKNN